MAGREDRSSMRRGRRSLILALVILLCGAWPAEAARAKAAPTRRLTARAAILIDNRSGQILYEREPDLRLAPASTTKILTALIALRSGALDRNVPVSPYAASMQPSKINLKPGWSMNMEDLVYAVLLNSANDASVVVAEGLGGSVEGFARQMNVTAYALGATHSHFVNPNGLPAENHYSTVRDLTTIMRHGLMMPHFRNILSTRTLGIRPAEGSNRPISLRSHNRMLARTDAHVIGKTGWTREAKRCFVGAATANDREIVFAVLGATDLWGDLARLIDFGLGRTDEVDRAPATSWQQATEKSDNGIGDDSRPERRPAATRGYAVQVASFRRQGNANSLREKLARQGYRPVVERVATGRKKVSYRVSLRGFPSAESAKKTADIVGRTCGVTPRVVAEGA